MGRIDVAGPNGRPSHAWPHDSKHVELWGVHPGDPLNGGAACDRKKFSRFNARQVPQNAISIWERRAKRYFVIGYFLNCDRDVARFDSFPTAAAAGTSASNGVAVDIFLGAIDGSKAHVNRHEMLSDDRVRNRCNRPSRT
jgi:hypothetical protein